VNIGVIGLQARSQARARTAAWLVSFMLVAPGLAPAQLCTTVLSQPDVQAALADISGSVDPCGQSAEIEYVLEGVRRCAAKGYEICINRGSERNSIDRAGDGDHEEVYITWNPNLRTELERGCAGDPKRPVLRDPHASLLHELTHLVQDCAGLDPNAYELEAVRVENIYRRARNLCQRTAYGAQPLPAQMLVTCEPGNCVCAPREPGHMASIPAEAPDVRPVLNTAAGDVAAPPTR
jgi:hypothetical protein